MSSTRIVIADDEPDILKIWAATFRFKGFEVMEASDGEIALKLIEEFRPEVALLDFMMPQMDGIAVCEQVRKTNESIVIMIVSGIGSDRLKELSQAVKADQYIEKPVRPTRLVEIVQAQLAARTTS